MLFHRCRHDVRDCKDRHKSSNRQVFLLNIVLIPHRMSFFSERISNFVAKYAKLKQV